jgi:hypothetical protein
LIGLLGIKEIEMLLGVVSISKTVIKIQSGKLKRQAGDFPQRGKSP